MWQIMSPHNLLSNAIVNQQGSHRSFDQSAEHECSTTLANSPINVNHLTESLKDYPNRDHAEQLEKGFCFGFKLGFIGEQIEQTSKNLTSAIELKPQIAEKLTKIFLKVEWLGHSVRYHLPIFDLALLGWYPKNHQAISG